MIQEFYAKQTVDKYACQNKPYKVVTVQALLQKTAATLREISYSHQLTTFRYSTESYRI